MSDPWDTLPQSWSWGPSCVPVLSLCCPCRAAGLVRVAARCRVPWPCCWTHKHRAVRAVRCPLFGAGSSCVPAGLVPGPRSCGPEAGPCHMAPGQWLSVLGRAVLGGCRMCRTRAPVCVHTSPGQGGMGGFGPLLHSAPLFCPIFAPHVAGISRTPWKPPCPALGTGGCPKMPPRTCSAAALPQSTNQEAPQWGTGMGLGGWGHGRAW